MNDYLFDTDAAIELIRRRNPGIARHVAQNVRQLFVSSATLMELDYGVRRSRDEDQARRALSEFLTVAIVVPFDTDTAVRAGALRHELSTQGAPIGPIDLLIAATAIQHGFTLVTGNDREFSRIAGLTTVNWLRQSE